MKQILTATFSILLSFTLSAQNFFRDTLLCFQWDTITSTWNFTERTIYNYDANENLIRSLSQNWDGTDWVNYKKDSIIYDANGNPTISQYYQWDTTNWVNIFQYTMSYDANGNQTSLLQQVGVGTNWMNDLLDTYTYDVNGDQISRLYQRWSGTNWMNTGQFSFAFDANRNQTVELRQYWNGTNWVNNVEYTYTYDNNRNRINFVQHTWDGTSWIYDFEKIYTYDASGNQTSLVYQPGGINWGSSYQIFYMYDANGDRISELRQNWDGTNWENQYQYLYNYDANGNQTSELYQTWDGNNWENDYNNVYSFDNDGNQTNELHQTWNGIVWINVDRCDYSYFSNNSLNCSAFFDLYPDTIPHHYYAINVSSGTTPLSYLWNWGDGNTDSVPYPIHNYDTAGFYTICLSIADADGCRDTFCNSYNLLKLPNTIIEVNVIPSMNTGIIENIEVKPLVFPNPASSYINVQLPYKVSKVYFRILNIVGQFQLSSTTTSQKTNLDISTLIEGIYILEVKTDNKISWQKFIKE